MSILINIVIIFSWCYNTELQHYDEPLDLSKSINIYNTYPCRDFSQFLVDNTSKDINEVKLDSTNSFLTIEKNNDEKSCENVIFNLSKKNPNNFREKDTNENLNKINLILSPDYIKDFKDDIDQYIECNISKIYRNFYLRRLGCILNIILFLDKCNLGLSKLKFLFASIDQELEKELSLVLAKVGNNMIFNQETYNLFNNELKSHTHNTEKLYLQEWCLLSPDEKALKSYNEFAKLYKYAYYIPEILTLGKLLTAKLSIEVAFTFHLMNVFFEKIGKPKDNEVFIKFLINNAFLYSSCRCLKLFSVPKFYIKCENNHENLQFFLWEIHTRIRHRIKPKTIKYTRYEVKRLEKVHMRIVLLLFLYQHIISLKCYGVTSKDKNTITDFVRRITKSEECVMCIFDDFLNLLLSQTYKLK